MLRAKMTQADGSPLFLFGLDAENVRRLTSGQPITVDLATLGGNGRLLICYGETLAHVVAELRAAGVDLPVPMSNEVGNA